MWFHVSKEPRKLGSVPYINMSKHVIQIHAQETKCKAEHSAKLIFCASSFLKKDFRIYVSDRIARIVWWFTIKIQFELKYMQYNQIKFKIKTSYNLAISKIVAGI